MKDMGANSPKFMPYKTKVTTALASPSNLLLAQTTSSFNQKSPDSSSTQLLGPSGLKTIFSMTLGSDNANTPYVSISKKKPIVSSFEQSSSLNDRIKHIDEQRSNSRKDSLSKDPTLTTQSL